MWAIIFVHAYTMYVYVFLFVSAGLQRFDGAGRGGRGTRAPEGTGCGA
jgi:hypothetical protein